VAALFADRRIGSGIAHEDDDGREMKGRNGTEAVEPFAMLVAKAK
jgi:hypothetical protein